MSDFDKQMRAYKKWANVKKFGSRSMKVAARRARALAPAQALEAVLASQSK